MTDPTWHTQEEAYEEPDTRPWWQRWRVSLVIGGVVLLFALLALPSVLARDQIDNLEGNVSNLETDLNELRVVADANKAALDEANRVLITLGQEPVTVPELDAERDDPDPNDPDPNDPEIQDPEVNDPDPLDDPETQDSEFDDPEIQEDEINDPDPVDDPDPCANPENCRGPAGMECPDGYTAREVTVRELVGMSPQQATIWACVLVTPT